MKKWIAEEIKNSPSIMAMIRWYKSLNARSQWFVKILLSVIVFWGIFSVLVASAIEQLNAQHQNYSKSERLYKEVTKNVARLKSLSNGPTGFVDRSSSDLQSIINQALKQYRVEPDSIANIGNDKVSLEFADVSFKKLSSFIKDIETQSVGVDSFYIEPKSTGEVNLSIVLD